VPGKRIFPRRRFEKRTAFSFNRFREAGEKPLLRQRGEKKKGRGKKDVRRLRRPGRKIDRFVVTPKGGQQHSFCKKKKRELTKTGK